ncbi:MAG: hypothetical protein IT289_13260, partial [Oligoflexia bacterium]|nr:hypothetical protein [Oligoflexia bacterium]
PPTDPQTSWDYSNNSDTRSFEATNDVTPQSSRSQITTQYDNVELRPVKTGKGLFPKITALGIGTLATVDGPDRETIIPGHVNNSIVGGFSGAVLSDLNLLSNSQMMFEFGAQMMSTGSLTGYQLPSSYTAYWAAPTQPTEYDEEFRLTYLGAAINFKYYVKSVTETGMFVKAGVLPSFLMSKTYDNFGTHLFNETRYGEFSTFDLLLTGAVGFTYKISNSLFATAEGGGFQGVIPVAANYNIYNAGAYLGLGISYLL